MVKIVIVNKGGDFNEKNISKISTSTFHKKCNFKTGDGFELRYTWNFGKIYVSLYARDHGNANTVNKYDLPPPLDNDLYFGKMLLVKHDHKKISTDNIIPLSIKEWEKMYDMLFGGFEDLVSEEEEETDEIPEHLKTEQGYMKDGFVVEDGDEEDEEDEDYVPDDSGENNDDVLSELDSEITDESEDENLSDCLEDDSGEESETSELSEENYTDEDSDEGSEIEVSDEGSEIEVSDEGSEIEVSDEGSEIEVSESDDE